MFRSQRSSYKYAVISYLFFALQGIVAIGGALETVFPDFPSPVPYTAGRAFHLNISVFWPLLGIMGATYYFFSQEADREISGERLINFNFWLLTGTVCLILGTLMLGWNAGREYLEAIWPLKVAVAIATILFGYTLFRTYLKSSMPRSRATLVSMLAGSATLILFYIPNIVSYRQPTVNEITKFLVVHLWEEMTLELLGTGILAALLIKVTGAERKVTEAAIYLDLAFIASAGVLATGHHYYWIGVPRFWLWLGGIFSVMQTVPTVLMVYAVFKAAKFRRNYHLDYREKVTMALIGSSMFYHALGAGALGLFMAYPPINRYVHGTYITSAHSHMALFGVFGFLVLGVSFYIIFSEVILNKKQYQWCCFAIIALNAGLLIMGIGLLLAGELQVYFWRVIGLSVDETNGLIKPYLFIRLMGGLVFAGGSTVLTFIVIKNIWFGAKQQDQTNCITSYKKLRQTYAGLQSLIQSEKEAERLLLEIGDLIKKLFQLNNKK
jgi:nitric oxide reductase subunit B